MPLFTPVFRRNGEGNVFSQAFVHSHLEGGGGGGTYLPANKGGTYLW